MRNLANIADNKTLQFFESTAVAKRSRELELTPIAIQNSMSLLAIHRHLFQDVYSWAGEVRTVEISKSGNPFFPTSRFYFAFSYIDQLIESYRSVPQNEKDKLAEKLAVILDNVNHLHPFREGNGRTQREFLRLLALEKGFILNLNPPNNTNIYERYMSGTIDGDIEKLTNLIFELIQD